MRISSVTRKLRLLAAAIAGISMAMALTTVQAGESFYVGAGVSYARDGSGCDIVDAQNNKVSTTQCDTSSTQGKLYAGYKITDLVGVEVGYAGLRSTSVTLVGGNSGKFEASGIPIEVVGFFPATSELTAIGKLGILRWSGKVTGNFASNASDSGFSFAIGAGAEYNLGHNLYVRGEVEYFPKVGKESTIGEADITLIGISIKYAF